jgi:predicted amidohydrolase
MEIRVYPEYFEGDVSREGVAVFAKMTEDSYSRMYVMENGKIKSHYDKIESDGNNLASQRSFSPVVHKFENIALGIICCMDIDRPDIVDSTMKALNRLNCQYKVIAVSAHMTHTGWFSSDSLPSSLHGAFVILSNGCDCGVKSFIASPEGKKVDGLRVKIGNAYVHNCGIT